VDRLYKRVASEMAFSKLLYEGLSIGFHVNRGYQLFIKVVNRLIGVDADTTTHVCVNDSMLPPQDFRHIVITMKKRHDTGLGVPVCLLRISGWSRPHRSLWAEGRGRLAPSIQESIDR